MSLGASHRDFSPAFVYFIFAHMNNFSTDPMNSTPPWATTAIVVFLAVRPPQHVCDSHILVSLVAASYLDLVDLLSMMHVIGSGSALVMIILLIKI
jgi:hypothetical protein